MNILVYLNTLSFDKPCIQEVKLTKANKKLRCPH